MTAAWAAILIASTGCYALKLVGVSLPDSILGHPRVQRTAGLLPVAMLTALVVADLFDANGHYTFDWRTVAGVGAGAVAIRFERSLPVVLLVAIAVTAALRAIS
jgi:branched-subunit amino acid transport protein